MKVEATHYRKGNTIIPVDGSEPTTFPSVNLAKRESAKIQQANGGLGAGAVRIKRR